MPPVFLDYGVEAVAKDQQQGLFPFSVQECIIRLSIRECKQDWNAAGKLPGAAVIEKKEVNHFWRVGVLAALANKAIE